MFIWRLTWTQKTSRAVAAGTMPHDRDSFQKELLAGLSERDVINLMFETETITRLLKSESPYDPQAVEYMRKYLATGENREQDLITRGIMIDKIEYLGDVHYDLT